MVETLVQPDQRTDEVGIGIAPAHEPGHWRSPAWASRWLLRR